MQAIKNQKSKMNHLLSLALALPLLSACSAHIAGPALAQPPAAATATLPMRATPLPTIAASTATSIPFGPMPTLAPQTSAAQAPGLDFDPAMGVVPSAADPAWDALRAELEGLVSSRSGDHAVSVTDLQTGRIISIHGARPQLAACTIKIGILMAVAQDLEAGRYSAEEIDALVHSAMGPSNTPPARELLAYAGGGDVGAGVRRVNEIMWGLGASGSILTHPPGYYGEEYGYAASHGAVDNLLTTNDLNLILVKLFRGEALSPAATSYVLWSMTLAPDWMNNSLGAPLPPEVYLFHKVGQLYGPHNTWDDAGIVVFERGGREYAYAISYLGSYGGSWQDAYALSQELSAAAWRNFEATYR
jgi:beta-lactamase class A